MNCKYYVYYISIRVLKLKIINHILIYELLPDVDCYGKFGINNLSRLQILSIKLIFFTLQVYAIFSNEICNKE